MGSMDALATVLGDPARTILGLDFDGTLSPIVADPDRAYVHPDSVAALRRIAPHLLQVAIITGRPALKAVELGGLDAGEGLGHLVVLGQYGIERWDASTGEVVSPPLPEAIIEVKQALPALLAAAGHPEAWIEDKGRAVAVHTRRLADPAGALADLEGPVAELAATHGLHLEPGKNVLEVRAGGFDKGDAVRDLVERLDPATFVYAGDDLGDIAAYDAVEALRGQGRTGVLVFPAAPGEDSPLAARADVVLEGTDGMAEWLTGLADALES
ncbi:trehalose 6-phosphate phosphatase [Raineyella antarctica]|uniref:Trehalose 6-phosphate phosphatase n=1 Tax=Raineyella antarctica TaxID=1577474 RepID=A0A1G6GWA5_9ACTN|nr:trehalose-phosphatase [Raineyella antarctica]SDB86332.1 trehalose 6-phosphate phosphatase [Raineyella antarctica]